MFADGAGVIWRGNALRLPGGACAVFPACSARRRKPASCATSFYAWYKEHAFPTYQPEMGIRHTTVSGAIECAVSVGKLHEGDRAMR